MGESDSRPVFTSICSFYSFSEGDDFGADTAEGLITQIANTIDIPDVFSNYKVEIEGDEYEDSSIILSDDALETPARHERNVIVIDELVSGDGIHLHAYLETELIGVLNELSTPLYELIPRLEIRNIGVDFMVSSNMRHLRLANQDDDSLFLNGIRLSMEDEEYSIQMEEGEEESLVRFYNEEKGHYLESPDWDEFLDDNIKVAQDLMSPLIC